ncbi:MAG: DUF2147 domain-containing protein [Pseudomonadota bacterium]
MRALATALLLAMAFAVAPASAGEPSFDLAGEWTPPNMDAVIRLQHCGDTLCADLVRHAYGALSDRDVNNPDETLRSRPLLGVRILDGFMMASARKWRGGSLYDPRTGRTYWSKIKVLDDNALKITACIGPGLCKGYVWTRADADDGKPLPSSVAQEQFSSITEKDAAVFDRIGAAPTTRDAVH